MDNWPPYRRAALNAHIAILRGWTNIAQTSMNTVFGTPPNSRPGLTCQTPKWADGVAETWDLLRELAGWGGVDPKHVPVDAAVDTCLEWCRMRSLPFHG